MQMPDAANYPRVVAIRLTAGQTQCRPRFHFYVPCVKCHSSATGYGNDERIEADRPYSRNLRPNHQVPIRHLMTRLSTVCL